MENKYKDLIADILADGEEFVSRNAGTVAVFGKQIDFDVSTFFPLLTCRRMYYKGVLGELAAFLRGPKCIEDFKVQGCNYWDAWADEDGRLNVDYGNAWLDFNGVNQLVEVVEGLKTNPYSRRHIITAWNPGHLNDLSLPCCHYTYQWHVTASGKLDMVWIQRSVDTMVGLPSDFILAAAFNILMANTVGLQPGRIIMQLGNTHIYNPHLEDVPLYMNRVPLQLPTWEINPSATVFNFTPDMLVIKDYQYHNPIKFELIP